MNCLNDLAAESHYYLRYPPGTTPCGKRGDSAMRALQRSSLVLEALPEAVPSARLHTRQVLSEWGLVPVADTAELLVSEWVTNGLKAAQATDWNQPISLDLSASQALLVIQVWDGSRRPPAVPELDGDVPSLDKECGRGLFLVEALSQVRVGAGCGGQGGAGTYYRQRQVVVDVAVHARQRELDGLDPCCGAPFGERAPRQRHGSRIRRGEVQVRERDIQPGHERRVGEEALAEAAVHLPGHVKVHPVEARESVCRGKDRLDRLHLRDCLGNRGHRCTGVLGTGAETDTAVTIRQLAHYARHRRQGRRLQVQRGSGARSSTGLDNWLRCLRRRD